MQKSIIVLLTAALLIGLAPGANAYSVSRTYVGASPGLVGLTTNAPSNVQPGSEFGGAHFAATGDAPLSVTATDASGLAIFVEACQDTDLSSICDAGEPTASGCGSVTLDSTFNPNLDTIVFIYGTDLPSTGCTGLATTGSITVEYADA